jgi:basic amino acid/polyamine antiporter, APA family
VNGHVAEVPLSLRRVIGRRDVLALAFGAMIGWGWVVLAGEMIDRAGTVGSALAFVLGGVVILLVGLTYAELTSALSRAGGELSFTFVAFGPRVAYVCGWTLVLAYLSVCAFEAVALPTVVGYLIPGFEWIHLYTISGWDVHVAWILVGVGGSVGIGLVNYLGIRMSSVVQWTAALALLLVGLSFFIPGNVVGDAANLEPMFTTWGGFFAVVLMTPFLFLGFDVIPQVAEEIKVPFRAIGRLILVSIGLAVLWYVLVQWTVGLSLSAGAREGRELITAQAMAAVYGSEWAGRFLVFGGALGILTSWNAFFLGATRIVFALARGGMIPAAFGRLHPKYESPVAAILLITGLSVLAPFLGRPALVWLVSAGSFAAVVAYFLVAWSCLRIRRRYPDLERPYRAPLPRATGVLALLATITFILLYLPGSPAALGTREWWIIGVWVALGLALAIAVRSRGPGLGERRQAERILGEHVFLLYREYPNPADPPATVDSNGVRGALSHEPGGSK